MLPAVKKTSKMTETYCGVKFKTVFKSKRVLNNPRIQELINWCTEFKKMGFIGDCEGNLSFRTDKGFIVSCARSGFSGLSSGDFTEVLAADISKKEIFVNGIKEPSSESFMHGEIYARRKDINAIFHGHSEDFLKYGERLGLPITEKEQPGGSIELMREVVKVLKNNNFILIRNHGFLSLGDTMGTAGNLAVKRYTQLQRVKRLV